MDSANFIYIDCSHHNANSTVLINNISVRGVLAVMMEASIKNLGLAGF